MTKKKSKWVLECEVLGNPVNVKKTFISKLFQSSTDFQFNSVKTGPIATIKWIFNG